MILEKFKFISSIHFLSLDTTDNITTDNIMYVLIFVARVRAHVDACAHLIPQTCTRKGAQR